MPMNMHMPFCCVCLKNNGTFACRRDAYFQPLGTRNFPRQMGLQQQSGDLLGTMGGYGPTFCSVKSNRTVLLKHQICTMLCTPTVICQEKRETWRRGSTRSIYFLFNVWVAKSTQHQLLQINQVEFPLFSTAKKTHWNLRR